MPLTTLLVKKEVCFTGQCRYFNPQRTPMQAINKAIRASWDKMQYHVLTYKSRFMEGLRWGGVHSGISKKA